MRLLLSRVAPNNEVLKKTVVRRVRRLGDVKQEHLVSRELIRVKVPSEYHKVGVSSFSPSLRRGADAGNATQLSQVLAVEILPLFLFFFFNPSSLPA